ncbi:MAG: hypothetical protein WCF19_04680 [Chlamydiales bacterium]
MDNQFQALQNWTFEVLSAIKKDIKSDRLHTDPIFYRANFGNRPQNRLTAEEIFAAYEKELLKGNNELAEWVVSRWIFKHGDLYNHFAERLSEVNPDFNEIKQLTEEESRRILDGAAESFGAIPTFIFSLLNGVVFPQSILDELQKGAEAERALLERRAESNIEQQSLEKVIASHQREVGRLNDKILGVQKKYERDTEALKKQIKGLQQKLNAR